MLASRPRSSLKPLHALALKTLLVAAVPAFGAAAGCSFLVESRDRQCESDADCEAEGAVCDVAGGVCVPNQTSSTSTGTDACIGPDGCYACAPETQVQFLEACTDAECIPYDNGQLAGLLDEDGKVPPVP